MRTTLEETKDDLIERAASLAANRKGAGSPPGDDAGRLLRVFYRHVAPEDINDRSEVDLYGGATSQYKLAATRPQGTANIRVFTPTVAEHGWSAGGHTVVEVVTDDMPFLVDSVTMVLTEDNRNVHMVVHPQLLVRRDMAGELQDLLVDDEMTPSADLPHDVFRESWMHLEIDRETSGDEVAAIEAALGKVLLDVREAVEDWERMRARAREIVKELEADPPPLPAEEVEEGKALLTWLADNHFTFLGYREYRLEGEDTSGDGDPDDVSLRAVPGTGFGILRSDQDMSTSFGKLPPLVRAKAREKTLLVLAKANSKATVHRPVYLDYVGVKTFDENGEVVGGAALPRVVLLRGLHRVADPDPGDPSQGAGGHRPRRVRAPEPHGQGPDGRAGDLPARRALPDPDRGAGADRRGGAAHPRAPPAAALRAPRHLRPLPLLPGLPAP